MRSNDFDYVIVGGGSARCVLGARLAAESGGAVALLERVRKDSSRWSVSRQLSSRRCESRIQMR